MKMHRGVYSSLLLLLTSCIVEAQYQRVNQLCGEGDFRCNNGKCILGSQRCNSISDCSQGEDEQQCVCRDDEFRCVSDGSCVEKRRRCDGINNCPDSSDEADCDGRCPADSFACNPSSSMPCGHRCDGRKDCDDGEDEDNCDDCAHWCDNKCLDSRLVCNNQVDCSDGSDEVSCDRCDGPNDFRCSNSDCINADQRCNGVAECSDSSDELNCNATMTPTPVGCEENEYACRDGTCINSAFYCDGNQDCRDNSDEDNCPVSCEYGSWTCTSGECIPNEKYCDGVVHCADGSDESECEPARPTQPAYQPPTQQPPYQPPTYQPTYPPTYQPPYQPTYPPTYQPPYQPPYPPYQPPYQPPTTAAPVYTTTFNPYRPYPPSGGSREDGPVALNLKTYPEAQKVRYAKYQVGGDVVFQCRDEGPQRVPVRWVREGGRPLKPGSTDRNGRLEMNMVSVSDSGVYICQATRYLGNAGSELRVQLTVESSATTQRPFTPCKPHEATCSNGQCIPKSSVCDGKHDCADGSDEDACHPNGMCEPNEFQCRNRKCVLKTWLCDSEDDCRDGSDEESCGIKEAHQLCTPVEFKCHSGVQCVPKSFHCDGQSDCIDGSDEMGCAPVHVTKPPVPSNVRMNPGETLTLVCEAVGVPTPLISWRLNWGHVPSKCSSTSANGVGTLTCPNMQPEDSGAYSCEAINNRGTTFAAPDSIVYVNKTDVCPNGFFNSEARSESECIPCFCFGESVQCRSADLFTYNMPTPLGEGGTRLLGVKIGYNGDIQVDSQPVTDQYYYQPLRNGATVTKIESFGSSWSYGSNAHPYLTLPETYNGNQLTSYGGHLKYTLSPHSPLFGSDENLPSIIIKGKYETLVHHYRGDSSRASYIEARLTPEHWQKSTQRGLIKATREDIMMALDNIQMILLRADLNNAGVNITDFAMESAQHINVGLGAASLVEECTCPSGYEGLSCQKCASGYVREKSGPWLGNCVREVKLCPAGTYGDPSSGYGCRPCPCPHTNPENQFARTCYLGPNGNVICDCAPGYGGAHCEYCEQGYVGNPLIRGDSCKPQPTSNCNSVGTIRSMPPDECQCKDQVQGRYCDQCKSDSFFLSEDFRHGCALCFCSGVSQQCMSSNLRRKTTFVRFNTPQIVDQVRMYSSAALSPQYGVKYDAPIETNLRPELVGNEITLTNYDQSRPTIYYWSLPSSFAGDKVTSYGGNLRYTLRYVPTSGPQNRNAAADVQLISDNQLRFHYSSNAVPSPDGILNVSVQFLEKGWHRSDGKEISREHFLLALADVKVILVKASYSANAQLSSLESASIETADANGDGPPALHVEQCVCPTGYVGTSCEDCAPGFTRSSSGLYLEHCEPCNCNGHSNMCNPESGECYDCEDNTAGENCESCKSGYEKNEYNICVPSRDNTSPLPDTCHCDGRGEAGPCTAAGCHCKQNVEGLYCDKCRAGTFGLDYNQPLGCLSCYCSGITTDCHEATYYSRIPMAAPIFGDNYGGYSITDLNAEQVINDQFVPAPNESELMYIFSFEPTTELYWSLPEFPGNRLASYGGTLSLTQSFKSSYPEQSTPGTDVILVGDGISLYWSNPTPIRSQEALSYQVPLRENGWFILNTAAPALRSDFMFVLKNLRRVLVRATLVKNIASTAIADVSMDTATDNYDPNLPAAKGVEICMCPEGYSGTSCESCSVGYYKDRYDRCSKCNCNGHSCQLGSRDEVVCNCRPPYSGPDCSIFGDSQLATTTTTRPGPPEPTVIVKITSPSIRIQEVGNTVNFTCQAQSRITPGPLPVTWSKEGGYLPQGRYYLNSGILSIVNIQFSDSGNYICQTSDGYSTGQAVATLTVPGNDMTLPTVWIDSPANEYYEGDTIQLQCVVTGNPTPKITWQRSSNRPLPLSSNSYETAFVIQNANVEDSGEYRCIARNSAGTTDAITSIVVRQKPSWPTRDRLTVSPTAATLNQGQSTRLVCTGTAEIKTGSINWVRQDGTPLLSNVRFENGVLYLDYVQPDNQGIYICQSTSSDAAPVAVLVTIVPLGTPAPYDVSNITVNVDRLKVPTGGNGQVECTPLGYPTPIVKWKKHEGSFGPGTSQRDNTLIITNAQEADQGYYLCEGLVDGQPIANIYVPVEIERREAPRVEIWPQEEQAVALGSEFEFHCRVMEGVPEPVVMWSRSGGRQLTSNAQIQPHNVLKFEKIEVNDEGEYICSATSVAGTHSASAVLKVRSPPEIIMTPGNYIQVFNGDSVNVECRASGYPEPIVSIRSSLDQRLISSPAPAMAVLRIKSVSERDEGSYVCSATSAAGTIQEEFVIRVDRGDGGFVDGGGSGDGEVRPDYNPDNEGGQPSSVIAFEGHDKKIECQGPPDMEVSWRRTDQPLPRNAVPNGAVLYIYNASKKDSGMYECSLVNRYNGELQRAAYTRLQIVAEPRITLRPKTQTVQPGQSPTVECIVEGDDIIDTTWRPVNRPLSRRVETRESTLIFHQIEVEDAGQYECFARSRYANASASAEVIVSGPREEGQSLISIDQPRRPFKVGENVEVLCRTSSRDTRVNWERYGNNQQRQFVESRTYADGSLLYIPGVEQSDAGVYRCTGLDPYGRSTYEDFNLEVRPASIGPAYPISDKSMVYKANLGDVVDLPCKHNLEQPVQYEWRREYTPLPAEIRTNEPNLNLARVTEADAGIYVCRVSNSRAEVEARAILTVVGVVPQFDGDSWLTLPTLKDAYRQFDIEISFKPKDPNGLILYNSQNQGRVGKYVALQLVAGVPEFVLDTGTGAVTVKGDRPLQLNTWHTIRVSRTNTKVTMDVDNYGPFTMEPEGQWGILELYQPLYIGGVPDYDQLPRELAGASGFIGCVSMLILGREEKNIMLDSIEKHQVQSCDSCTPNLCLNNGVCQESRNERGYTCLCPAEFAGQNCDQVGEACRAGLCGPGKCTDTADGYKCACPVAYSGRNCETKQSIEYPAFTGSAYLAIKAPDTSRYFQMEMKIKATSPISDGIIMYCAESARGYGGFMSLAVHDGKLEFRYNLGDGSVPVILAANKTLPTNEWTAVHISRMGYTVALTINKINKYQQTIESLRENLHLETPMFVGGVDDSITLNSNTGVVGGFSGCIKDVKVYGDRVDIVNSSIQSANVQECSNYDRGDIPEMDGLCNQCRNGGYCQSADSTTCTCPPEFAGAFCENRVSQQSRRPQGNPCAAQPCRNGGTCRPDSSTTLSYSCDCPLRYAGTNCQMPLELQQSVGFNGNGYLEISADQLRYDNLQSEPVVIALAFYTSNDGILLYQREARTPVNYGDYVLLRVDRGRLILEWDWGSGNSTLSIDNIYVSDGQRHMAYVTMNSDNTVTLTVDRENTRTGTTTGISNLMNADSNVYIGGVPSQYNVQRYPGFTGCIEQIELMDSSRGLNLGQVAVAGINTQRCRDARS